MVNLHILLFVLAFVCFLAAAVGVPSTRVGLVPLGLAFWVLALIVQPRTRCRISP